MYWKTVFLNCIYDFNLLSLSRLNPSAISNLSAAFSIERASVKYKLYVLLVLGFYFSVFKDFYPLFNRTVVSCKFSCCVWVHLYPVTFFNCSCIAAAVFLLLEFCLKLFEVYSVTVLFCNKFCKVYRESESVIQYKCILSGYHLGLGIVLYDILDKSYSFVQSSEECLFLLLDYFLHNQLL